MTEAKTYYNGPPDAANGLALRILPGSTLSDVCAAGHMTPPIINHCHTLQTSRVTSGTYCN